MKRTIFGFFKKEFTQVLRDPKMRVLLFVAPMVQISIFGLALKNEVKNVKLAAPYSINDPLLNNIVNSSIASTWFVPTEYNLKLERDPFEIVRGGYAEVALVSPPGGLTKAFERGDGKLQILIDSTNLLRARAVENYLKVIINQEIAKYTGKSIAPKLQISAKILYNPTMNTAFFLVPGVMCMLITIVTVQLTAMSLAKEKEIGTFETLISAPVRTSEILIGKTFPFFVIGSLDVPLVAAVAILGFGVPMRGSYLELAFATLFFVMTTVSIGVLISTICKNQQQAMMGGFLFIFPAIILSGVFYPLDNMPLMLKWLAYLNPLKYYVTLLRNIMLKGGDPSVVWSNIGILFLIAAFAVIFAFKRFKLTL